MTLCEACNCYPCCCGGDVSELTENLRDSGARSECEAYEDRIDAADEIDRLTARVAELEAALVREREDNLWNAYGVGHERDGRWRHSCMSEAEWLIREIGMDPSAPSYDAGAVKAAIPYAARAALNRTE